MNPAQRTSLSICMALSALLAAITGCASPANSPDAARPAASAPAPAVVAAADVRSRALVNPGFESGRPGENSDFEGWYTYQHAGALSYVFVLDADVKHGGARSVRVDNIGSEPYGSISQALNGQPFAGKTVRFSAWLKTRDAIEEGVALFIIAERGGAIHAHDFMAGREVKGTQDWTRYAITLAVPAFTDRLRVGATMQGKGSAWLDDAELEIVAVR